LLHQYGLPITALSLDGEEFQKKALFTDEVYAEWTTFRHYIAKQPKEDILSQLYDLSTNEMLKPMFPNLRTLVIFCISLIFGTASVERSFSKMKMIKSRLRNRLSEKSLSYLMKISIESAQKLTDEDLEMMIEIWTQGEGGNAPPAP